VFWLLLAALAAVRGRWGQCGIACALGIATKQNALFYLPLIIVVGMCVSPARCLPRTARWRTLRNGLLRFGGFLLVGLVLLGLWSAARAAPVDFWTLGTYNNDPGRFIRANELLPRLNNWILLLGNVTGFSPILLLACVPLFAVRRSRESLLDGVLAITLLTFLLGYWLIAFNVYDRYLLPLGPLALLLVARGALRLGGFVPLLVLLLMIPFTANVLLGRTDVGSNHDPYAGITRLVSELNALPPGSKVYDYSLDWELGFYLGDIPNVLMIWQPTPEALARAVCKGGADTVAQAAYFATPAADAEAWLWVLKKAGGGSQMLSGGPFRLYRLDCTF
ncbi:MAG TPA: hypothetical protein VKQ72_20315, partial [Aggregatilineales bacterium]|nr:hypothetical protein [Aggregatilineales bacterium]